jgi:hypothetical protein
LMLLLLLLLLLVAVVIEPNGTGQHEQEAPDVASAFQRVELQLYPIPLHGVKCAKCEV